MMSEKAKKTTILLVDNDQLFCEPLMWRLKAEGYRIIFISSADRLLNTIDEGKEQFDLVLMDLMMPHGKILSKTETEGGRSTGVILAQRIRDKYPKVPIIAISVRYDDHICNLFRECYNGFIGKPATPSYVVKKIEQVLGRKKIKSFIIHGQDNETLLELKDYVQNTLLFDLPIVLRDQPSLGRTIIEKFEQESKDVDIVFVLLTPDDTVIDSKSSNSLKRRARQNVILELGYFYAKLQRSSGRILLLYKGELELPSDILGVVYIDVSDGIKKAGEDIRRELKDFL